MTKRTLTASMSRNLWTRSARSPTYSSRRASAITTWTPRIEYVRDPWIRSYSREICPEVRSRARMSDTWESFAPHESRCAAAR